MRLINKVEWLWIITRVQRRSLSLLWHFDQKWYRPNLVSCTEFTTADFPFSPRRDGDKADWKVFCGVEHLLLAPTWFYVSPYSSLLSWLIHHKHTSLCDPTSLTRCCQPAGLSAELWAWLSVWSGDMKGPGARWRTSWELGQSLAGNMSGMCYHKRQRETSITKPNELTVSAILRFISAV